MLKIALHAYTLIDHLELEARLARAVIDCNGWILEEMPLSLGMYRIRFEIGLANIAEIYGAMQQAELQFTTVAHRALTEMCLCRKYLSCSDDMQIVSIDLQVDTLGEGNIRFRRFVQPDPT